MRAKATPCIEFQGYRNEHGYGQVNRLIDGQWRRVYVHREAWEKEHGPLAEDEKVLHSCDNPPCFNVEHLFVGTQMDNLTDMKSKGRQAKGSAVRNSRLTESDVVAIRKMLSEGATQKSVANMYGVCRQTIGYVKNYGWQHI